MTYEELKNNDAVKIYIESADKSLHALGFTEHSFPHTCLVAERAGEILLQLGFDSHTIELGKIAGFLHDIGNIVNRVEHSQSSAVMAFYLMNQLAFEPSDIATVCAAIGNHDEGTGTPVNEVAAALILADKSDVRRSRVREKDVRNFDIHDRVNFSVTHSQILIDKDNKILSLKLSLDPKYGSVMEYFEIFMERMLLCRKAADALGLGFKLFLNEQQMI
jgi:metal-dependent HD superfamily phosphatase/phosphodiesterase